LVFEYCSIIQKDADAGISKKDDLAADPAAGDTVCSIANASLRGIERRVGRRR
jgi:hypothetical protein